jgi:hypothetical protein
MAWRQVGLVAQIEKGALDESIPLTSTLRKCVVLGGHAGSPSCGIRPATNSLSSREACDLGVCAP